MNHKYIDLENYNILNKLNFFEVDPLIANIISILNKKGYETKASCESHYKTEFVENFVADIEFLDEVKSNNHYIVRNIRKKDFEYAGEICGDSIYILFSKLYDFNNLPDGFHLSDDKLQLSHDIYYYNENDERISKIEFEKDKNKHLKFLLEWAKLLPDNYK